MKSNNEDVAKLLGKIDFESFGYRSFGADKRPDIRIVRSAGTVVESVEDVVSKRTEVVDAVIQADQDIPALSAQTAITSKKNKSGRIGDAFERIVSKRKEAVASKPRIHLNLEARPPMVFSRENENRGEKSWLSIVARLNEQVATPCPDMSTPTRLKA